MKITETDKDQSIYAEQRQRTMTETEWSPTECGQRLTEKRVADDRGIKSSRTQRLAETEGLF